MIIIESDSSQEPPCSSAVACSSKQEQSSSSCPLDELLSMFAGKLSPKQVISVFRLSQDHLEPSIECLLTGPTLDGILKMMMQRYDTFPAAKLYVEASDAWSDTVAYYKRPSADPSSHRIRVVLQGQPAIDTGGVRRQLYVSVLRDFAENVHMRLFDGPPNHLRPLYSAEARASGLFTVLGTIVGHAILQEGIGFPYLSPMCFWYLACGEETALKYASLVDVGSAVATVISKVFTYNFVKYLK